MHGVCTQWLNRYGNSTGMVTFVESGMVEIEAGVCVSLEHLSGPWSEPFN